MKIFVVFLFFLSGAVSFSTLYSQNQYKPPRASINTLSSSSQRPPFSFYLDGRFIYPLVTVDVSGQPKDFHRHGTNNHEKLIHSGTYHTSKSLTRAPSYMTLGLAHIHKNSNLISSSSKHSGGLQQPVSYSSRKYKHYSYPSSTIDAHIVRQTSHIDDVPNFAHNQPSHDTQTSSYMTLGPAHIHKDSKLISSLSSHSGDSQQPVSYSSRKYKHYSHPSSTIDAHIVRQTSHTDDVPNFAHNQPSHDHHHSIYKRSFFSFFSKKTTTSAPFHSDSPQSHSIHRSPTTQYQHQDISHQDSHLLASHDLHSTLDRTHQSSAYNTNQHSPLLSNSGHGQIISSNFHDQSSDINNKYHRDYHSTGNLRTDHHENVLSPSIFHSSQSLTHPSTFHFSQSLTYPSTDTLQHQVGPIDSLHYDHHDDVHPIHSNDQTLNFPQNTELTFPVRKLRLVHGKPTLDLGSQRGVTKVVLQVFSSQASRLIAGIGVSVSSSSHAPASVCYSPNAYTFRYSSSSQITLSCRQTLVGNFVVFDGVTLGHLISVVSSIKVTVTALSGGGFIHPIETYPLNHVSYLQSSTQNHHYVRHVRLLSMSTDVWQIKFSRLLTVTRVNIISGPSPSTYTSLRNIEILISKKRFTNRECLHNTRLCARNTAPFPPSSQRLFTCQPAQGNYLILRGLDGSFQPRDIIRVDVYALERPGAISVEMLEKEFYNYGRKIFPNIVVPPSVQHHIVQPVQPSKHITRNTYVKNVIHSRVHPEPPTHHITHNVHVNNVDRHIVQPVQPSKHITRNTYVKNVQPVQPSKHITRNTYDKNVVHPLVIPAQPSEHITHNTVIKNVQPVQPSKHITRDTYVIHSVHPFHPDYPTIIHPAQPPHPKYPSVIHPVHPFQPNYPSVIHPVHPSHPDYPTIIHPVHPSHPSYPSVIHPAPQFHPSNPTVIRPLYPSHPSNPSVIKPFPPSHPTVIHPFRPSHPSYSSVHPFHPKSPNAKRVVQIEHESVIHQSYPKSHSGQTVIYPSHPFHPNYPLHPQHGMDHHNQALIPSVTGGCNGGYGDKLCVPKSMTYKVKECLNTLWQFFSQINK